MPTAEPLVFGSEKANRYLQEERTRSEWQPLQKALAEAREQAEFWRIEAARLENAIDKLLRGETSE